MADKEPEKDKGKPTKFGGVRGRIKFYEEARKREAQARAEKATGASAARPPDLPVSPGRVRKAIESQAAAASPPPPTAREAVQPDADADAAGEHAQDGGALEKEKENDKDKDKRPSVLGRLVGTFRRRSSSAAAHQGEEEADNNNEDDDPGPLRCSQTLYFAHAAGVGGEQCQVLVHALRRQGLNCYCKDDASPGSASRSQLMDAVRHARAVVWFVADSKNDSDAGAVYDEEMQAELGQAFESKLPVHVVVEQGSQSVEEVYAQLLDRAPDAVKSVLSSQRDKDAIPFVPKFPAPTARMLLHRLGLLDQVRAPQGAPPSMAAGAADMGPAGGANHAVIVLACAPDGFMHAITIAQALEHVARIVWAPWYEPLPAELQSPSSEHPVALLAVLSVDCMEHENFVKALEATLGSPSANNIPVALVADSTYAAADTSQSLPPTPASLRGKLPDAASVIRFAAHEPARSAMIRDVRGCLGVGLPCAQAPGMLVPHPELCFAMRALYDPAALLDAARPIQDAMARKRILVVTGKSTTAKSATLATLANVSAAHVFLRQDPIASDPHVALRSIALQLCDSVPGFRRAVVAQLRHGDASAAGGGGQSWPEASAAMEAAVSAMNIETMVNKLLVLPLQECAAGGASAASNGVSVLLDNLEACAQRSPSDYLLGSLLKVSASCPLRLVLGIEVAPPGMPADAGTVLYKARLAPIASGADVLSTRARDVLRAGRGPVPAWVFAALEIRAPESGPNHVLRVNIAGELDCFLPLVVDRKKPSKAKTTALHAKLSSALLTRQASSPYAVQNIAYHHLLAGALDNERLVAALAYYLNQESLVFRMQTMGWGMGEPDAADLLGSFAGQKHLESLAKQLVALLRQPHVPAVRAELQELATEVTAIQASGIVPEEPTATGKGSKTAKASQGEVAGESPKRGSWLPMLGRSPKKGSKKQVEALSPSKAAAAADRDVDVGEPLPVSPAFVEDVEPQYSASQAGDCKGWEILLFSAGGPSHAQGAQLSVDMLEAGLNVGHNPASISSADPDAVPALLDECGATAIVIWSSAEAHQDAVLQAVYKWACGREGQRLVVLHEPFPPPPEQQAHVAVLGGGKRSVELCAVRGIQYDAFIAQIAALCHVAPPIPYPLTLVDPLDLPCALAGHYIPGSRGFALDSIADWASTAQRKSNVCVVVGDKGSGCSTTLAELAARGIPALAQRLVAMGAREQASTDGATPVYAVHSFSLADARTMSARDAIVSIVRQLGRRLPSARHSLAIARVPHRDTPIGEFLSQILVEPLKQCAEALPVGLVVIDGLDECDPDDRVEFASSLYEVWAKLPPWILCVLSMTRKLYSPPQGVTKPHTVEFAGRAYRNGNNKFLKSAFTGGAAAVLDKVGGSLQYVQLLGLWPPSEAVDVSLLPDAKDLMSHLEAKCTSSHVPQHELALATVVAAHEPLPLALWRHVCGKDMNEDIVRQLTGDGGPLRLCDYATRVTVRHASAMHSLLHDRVVSEKALQDAHSRLAKTCARVWDGVAGAANDALYACASNRAASPSASYALMYGVSHMVEAGFNVTSRLASFRALYARIMGTRNPAALETVIRDALGAGRESIMMKTIAQALRIANSSNSALDRFPSELAQHVQRVFGAEAQALCGKRGRAFLDDVHKFDAGGDPRFEVLRWERDRVREESAGGSRMVTIKGHAKAILGLDWWTSPQGRVSYLVSASRDKTCNVYNAVTGAITHRLAGEHSWEVSVAVISPNGRYVVSGAADGSLVVWGLADGSLEGALRGHTDAIVSATFSAASTVLATAARNGDLIIWELESGKMLHKLEHRAAKSKARQEPETAPEDEDESGDVELKRALSGASEAADERKKGEADGEARALLLEAKFLPTAGGSSLVLSATADGMLTTWDCHSGKAVQRLHDKELSELASMALAPDGKYVAACGGGTDSGRVAVWSLAAEGSEGSSSSSSEAIHLWRVDQPVMVVVFSHSSKLVAVGGGEFGPAKGRVFLFNVESGDQVFEMREHSLPVRKVRFSHNDEWILSASSEPFVVLWSVGTGELLARLEGHAEAVSDIAFSANEALAVSSDEAGKLIMWDCALAVTSQAGGLEREQSASAEHDVFREHRAPVTVVAFSRDGSLIATGSSDSSVVLWDAEKAKARHHLKGLGGSVLSLSFSGNNALLAASGTEVKPVCVFDVETGSTLHTLLEFGTVHSVAFDSRDTLFTSAIDFNPNTAGLWVRGQCTAELEGAHSQPILRGMFSHNGAAVVTCGEDLVVALWDAKDGKLLSTLGDHTARVNELAFRKDGKALVTGVEKSQDLRVWDTELGQLLCTVKQARQGPTLSWVRWLDNGSLAVLGDDDQPAHYYDATTGAPTTNVDASAVNVKGCWTSYGWVQPLQSRGSPSTTVFPLLWETRGLTPSSSVGFTVADGISAAAASPASNIFCLADGSRVHVLRQVKGL